MTSSDSTPQNLLTRLTPGMLAEFHASGFWGDATICQLAESHAAASPTKPAVRDSLYTASYGDLVELAGRIAADLHQAGLQPGDRVAAWMSSRVESAAFLLASSRNGYVFCPSLHRNHTAADVAALLGHMRAKAFVAESGYGVGADDRALAEIESGDGLLRSYRMPPLAKRTATDIAQDLGLAASAESPRLDQADNVVYLAFTSGTTGDPKGVMHSNNTLLANARAIAADWSFGTASVTYTLSPMSHNLGFGALVLTMLVGGEIVLHDPLRTPSLLARLRETGATFLFGVPTHAADLLKEIESEGEAGLDALTGFRISGAAAPTVVVEKLLSHGIVPQSGYGMTEGCSHHYTLPGDDPATIVGTSGRSCPGYDAKVFEVEDPDKEVPVGEVGQIGARGASLMLGYFDNQRATEDSFNRTGWFMTGDLGRLDADGRLKITGRIKDVIIRGGHNIYPAQIESMTMRHPAVERAAAIPVADDRLGEKVCIVVMAKAAGTVDPMDLLRHLDAEGLSKFDMPEYFLAVDEIPLSASGKILKRALLPSVRDGTLKPQPVRWSA